jgi:hypothetical protein
VTKPGDPSSRVGSGLDAVDHDAEVVRPAPDEAQHLARGGTPRSRRGPAPRATSLRVLRRGPAPRALRFACYGEAQHLEPFASRATERPSTSSPSLRVLRRGPAPRATSLRVLRRGPAPRATSLRVRRRGPAPRALRFACYGEAQHLEPFASRATERPSTSSHFASRAEAQHLEPLRFACDGEAQHLEPLRFACYGEAQHLEPFASRATERPSTSSPSLRVLRRGPAPRALRFACYGEAQHLEPFASRATERPSTSSPSLRVLRRGPAPRATSLRVRRRGPAPRATSLRVLRRGPAPRALRFACNGEAQHLEPFASRATERPSTSSPSLRVLRRGPAPRALRFACDGEAQHLEPFASRATERPSTSSPSLRVRRRGAGDATERRGGLGAPLLGSSVCPARGLGRERPLQTEWRQKKLHKAPSLFWKRPAASRKVGVLWERGARSSFTPDRVDAADGLEEVVDGHVDVGAVVELWERGRKKRPRCDRGGGGIAGTAARPAASAGPPAAPDQTMPPRSLLARAPAGSPASMARRSAPG